MTDMAGMGSAGVEALRLAALGVAVTPGTTCDPWGRCSCRRPRCPEPGGHPRSTGWLFTATTSPEQVRRWWTQTCDAAVVVPLLGDFQVLDVAAEVGAMALRLMAATGEPLGPISVSPDGRYRFWARLGADIDLATRLGRHDRRLADTDIHVLSTGDYVTAPPSAAGRHGRLRWEQPPTRQVRDLPDPGPLVAALVVASLPWQPTMCTSP